MAKDRKSWGRLQGILRREGATKRVSGIVFQGSSAAGAAVWGGDVGGVPDDGAGAERIPPWGSKKARMEIAAEREGRGMELPLTKGGHGGGGTYIHLDINPEKAEHGCAVHCYATASGPMRGRETERGSEGYFKVVGTVRN